MNCAKPNGAKTDPYEAKTDISKIFQECWNTETIKTEFPNSMIQSFKLKQAIQIVYKKNKGWIFDYKESVLYTLTQMAALFIYALQKGCTYKETIVNISNYYKLPVHRVDADYQEFLAEMYKLQLIELTPKRR